MCSSAIRSIPTRGGGRGGTTGGVGVGARDEDALDSRRVPILRSVERGLDAELVDAAAASSGRGLWYASLESWKVRRAVSMRISRPLRSSMSNLQTENKQGSEDTLYDDAPVEIVIENLHRGCLQSP